MSRFGNVDYNLQSVKDPSFRTVVHGEKLKLYHNRKPHITNPDMLVIRGSNNEDPDTNRLVQACIANAHTRNTESKRESLAVLSDAASSTLATIRRLFERHTLSTSLFEIIERFEHRVRHLRSQFTARVETSSSVMKGHVMCSISEIDTIVKEVERLLENRDAAFKMIEREKMEESQN